MRRGRLAARPPALGQRLRTRGRDRGLDWAFANVDLPNDEVVSFTTVANTNSRRVMEKIGMVHDIDDDFDHPLLPDWAAAAVTCCTESIADQFAEHVAR